MNNVCFNVLSLNVRGIRDLNKCKSIFTWDQKADFIFLQETLSTPDVLTVGNFSGRETCIIRTDQIIAMAFWC